MRRGRGLSLLLVSALGLSMVASSAPSSAGTAEPVNAIVAENELEGTPSSEWDVNGAGDPSIQGFATDISVNRGEEVDFKIDTTAAAYEIRIYRLGYYGGDGARHVATIASDDVAAQDQPTCQMQTENGNLLDCGHWEISARWTVPADATSGIYIARPTRTDNGRASHIPFIVRDDASTSDLLFQTSDTTWQAYNRYGDVNLYGYAGNTHAQKVSYNRPFTTRGTEPENWLFNAEYPMLRWLERNGYDVSYTTNVDTARRGELIKNHKVFLSLGHDEYWSQEQRDAVEAARDAGVHLAFFSGNEVYWKIRWEEDADGTDHRTQVTYKQGSAAPSGSGEHYNCFNNYTCDPTGAWTGLWREDPDSSPENSLTGQISWRLNTDSIRVPGEYAPLRFWRDTDVAGLGPAGEVVLEHGTLGYEWNPESPQYARHYPPGRILLSTTSVNSFTGPEKHHLSLYRASSGALVFGAGTVQWMWGLDGNHDKGTSKEDRNVQQATVNLFADMGVQPKTLQSGLVVAAASTDTTPPAITVTHPAAGTRVPGGAVTATGTATDADGAVAAVEVSTDGGSTWVRAQGRENWNHTFSATDGPAEIRVRATDDSVNLSDELVHTFEVAPRECPCSLWTDADTPATVNNNDNEGGIEVGVRFQATEDGYLTGLRQYWAPGDTGTHTATLWSNAGQQLATATFAPADAAGWQTAPLDRPVAITAGTTYVASRYSPSGHYSLTANYFPTEYRNTPLVAPAHTAAAPNGVYKYGASGFPTETWNATNYWVDVVFTEQDPGDDTTPPRVTAVTPQDGATAVPVDSPVSATFSEPIDETTLEGAFTLRDAAGDVVTASMTYSAATRRATLNPTEALAPTTAYTATVRGGTDGIADPAGNRLAEDVTWSFTTAAAPGACPCSIWTGTETPSPDPDTGSVELGVKFRSDEAGFVTGLRFYKPAGMGGQKTGRLWTATGTQLASLTFAGETASGWQEATFDTPVAIEADTTYVASYHAPSGGYAATREYFSQTGVDNPPLRALRSGVDGGNGVYTYGPGGSFPTSTFEASNYWVDVVFVTDTGPDTTPPRVNSTVPADGAANVDVSTAIRATFNERLDAASVTGETFTLAGPGGTSVPATVTYDDASRTAVLTPADRLAYETAYTASVSGVEDLAANAMEGTHTWSFTTGAEPPPPPPPPDEGPGGPILVISSDANPFSRYYAEILRNEGLNAFSTTNLSALTREVLDRHTVAVLGEVPVTAGQAALLRGWVEDGGNLIAMRPDADLADLLGLTRLGTTLAGGYLRVDTSSAPGAGIVGETMQYHGTADRYQLAGGSTIATLYSNATTATDNPAVTTRTVGDGTASAFAYDLARSVVSTRQGNPAWAGQERDGNPPIRSNDLFHPDHVDFSKIQIPQADEQQRLLANLITSVSDDTLPLPRFWYFPRGKKAVVVMTGDDHANGGTAPQFEYFKQQSPPGCDVDDWECIRSTSYLYPHSPLTDAQAAQYEADGFEVGIHVDTGCANWANRSALEGFYTRDLAAFADKYRSVPQPTTHRTHCIVWSDWTTQPKVELANGIRLDTNYYYWPGSWVQDRPGMFTGSGMPMRFADLDGTMIDVYQATTQLTDESGLTYSTHINTLLDNAIGDRGFYGAFTTNMHTDAPSNTGAQTIVAAAKARGVPVVSARQMLTWLDGRNGSSFADLAFADGTLTFRVDSRARGLQAMVPAEVGSARLDTLAREGQSVSYTLQTIKGVEYAVFAAGSGEYVATYGEDATGPTITDLQVAPRGDGTATVTWTTDGPATSEVVYGTAPDALSGTASVSGQRTAHRVTLEDLEASTTYYLRARSDDNAGNTTTAPPEDTDPLSFTTPGAQLMDTTVADFAAGERSGTFVTDTAGGEVTATPMVGAEFYGPTLPAGWESGAWNEGGAASVADGRLAVDGAYARTTGLHSPGRVLEFRARFSDTTFQNAGFAVDFNDQPYWAAFGIGNAPGQLYARVNPGGAASDTPLGDGYFGAEHVYRIEWTPTQVRFLIDGTLVHTADTAITADMRPVFSDYNTGGGALSVDWVRMSPYTAQGTFTSRVFDAGATVGWQQLGYDAQTPTGTTLNLAVRTRATADGSWSDWQPVANGAAIDATSRYLQYQATFTTSDPDRTAVLEEVRLDYSDAAENAPPVLGEIGDQTVAEGQELRVPLSASDPDNDSLSFSVAMAYEDEELPGWIRLSHLTTTSAALTITPGFDDAGTYQLTVTVTDGADDAGETFTLTVTDTNRAPSITNPGDQTGTVGDPVDLQIAATDPDGDTLIYSAEGLPDGLTIDADTGMISGTLTTAGTYPVAVTVTDDGEGALSASDEFTWTVTAAPGTTAPEPPQGVAATVSTVAVTLRWTANTESDLAGYRVERSVDGGTFQTLTPALLTATTFIDTAAPTQRDLTYRVIAVDESGNPSQPSDVTTRRDIWIRGTATAQNGGKTNSIVVPRPSGTQPLDLLVTVIDVRGAATVAPPAGWVLARQDVSGNAVRQVTYYRVATGNEPTSYTWNLSARQGASAVSAAYGGVDPIHPFDVSGGQPTATGTRITAPSITTTVDGALLVGGFGTATNTSISPPDGMIAQGYVAMNAGQNKVATQLADQLLPSTGATGPRVATANGAGANIGQAIAFRPGSADPGPDTQPPSQPTGLQASVETEPLAVQLTWTASTDNVGVTGYAIYRNDDKVGEVNASTHFADTEDLGTNTTYTYQVQAFDAAGNRSALSAPATVTIPGTPPPAVRQITFVGAASGADKEGTTVVVPRPAGLQAGDLLLASIDAGPGDLTVTAPAGWTLVRQDTASGNMTKATFRKVASAEPTSYTFALSRSAAASGVISAYRNVDIGNPIANDEGQASAAASATIVAPSVATDVAGTIVAFYGTATNATITPASTMTKRAEAVSNGQLKMTSAVGDERLLAAGATGPRPAIASKAASNIGHLVVLRPSSGS